MSNREEATFIIFGLLVAFILVNSDLRRSSTRVLKQLLLSKVALPFLIFIGGVVVTTWGAAAVGIWSRGLVGAEVIWFFSAGFVWFMRLPDAGKHPDFFRKRLLEALSVAAFMEIFFNLATLSLIGELILQIVLILLAGMIVVAGLDGEQKHLVRPLRFIVGTITLSLAIYTVAWLTGDWGSLDKKVLLQQLLMPIWLTACAAVCFYPVVLLMGYEVLFVHMRWANNDATPRLRARLGVIFELRGSWVKIQQLTGSTLHEPARATTVREARRGAAKQLRRIAARGASIAAGKQ